MEDQEYTSDVFNYSPRFQVDKYVKTIQLDIPDTIPENCSAELIEESDKMKGSKEVTQNDDKENIRPNSPTNSVKSLDISCSIEIDHSYIKQCEQKLLECSFSDDERSTESDNNHLVKSKIVLISRKNPNDTISTPPSLLRKEISILRSEMAEAHEFHDLEIQLLQEEKGFTEINIGNYLELFEKYSALMELYTSLKTEYDNYREEQEKLRNELECKTADCLESLCSQIETSDSSFNFSGISCLSMNGRAHSSMKPGNLTEVECTVVQDSTVLANDPLSVTGEIKTPSQTPQNNDKWNLILEESFRELTEATKVTAVPSQSEYYIQCLNLETALFEKIKEVEALEKRLLKVETLSLDLQCEFDRINSIYVEENSSLKATLSLRSEQLNELRQELLSETVSLNPSLKDSLADVPGKKLLLVFMETIMESCRKIKCEDTLKTIEDLRNQLASQETKLIELDDLRKTCECLEKKLSELNMKSREAEMTAIKEKLLETDSVIQQLKSQLKSTEEEKSKLQALCGELQKTNQNLVLEIFCAKNLENQVEETQNDKGSEGNILQSDNNEVELKTKSEEQPKETSKVEELITEIEQLKKENTTFLKVLKTVEEAQKRIAEMLLDVENSDMPSEKIGKLISDLSKLPDSDEMKESKVIAGFVEMLGKMCKRVQSELIKECETQKLESEAQRAIDQELLQSLQDQISLLTEKCNEYETEITATRVAKDNLTKESEMLKNQTVEAEKFISTLNEEINRLASQEIILKQTKDELTVTNKIVEDLKHELSVIENEKQQIELRCVKLGKHKQDLEFANEVILKELGEVKENREKLESENASLKEQVKGIEEEIHALRKQMEKVEEEKATKEAEINNLNTEICILNAEKERYLDLSEKLKCFENSNKNFKEVFLDLREYLDLPEDIVTDINCGVIKNEKLFRERIDQLVLSNLTSLDRQIKRAEIESKELELETLREKCEVLEAKLLEAENDVFTRDEEIKKLRKEIKLGEAEFFEAKEALLKLESELKQSNNGKAELDIRCGDFEKLVKSLNEKILEKENLCQELEIEKSKIETTYNELKESYDILKTHKAKTEHLVYSKDEEIRVLKSCETELCQVKDNLNTADRTILNLKSELRTLEEEKSELMFRCTELQGSNETLVLKVNEAKNVENNPMYQEIKDENDLLKRQIFDLEQNILDLTAELNAAKEIQKKNLHKMDDLLREIEDLRVKDNEFNRALDTMDETQKKMLSALSEPELSVERIKKLIEETIPDSAEQRESKLYSGFVCSVMQTCEGLQNKLVEKFNKEKREWEIQKETDNEKLKELKGANKEQSIALEQRKNQLDEADEKIQKLKSQLTEAETVKAEVEVKCQILEENATTLQREIDNKSTILKKLEELKIQKEKVDSENRDLKQHLLESEKALAVMKNCLELANEEQTARIAKIKDLEDEIKTEKECLNNLSENLNQLEMSNRKLVIVLSDIVKAVGVPEDIEKVLSEDYENPEIINFVNDKIKGLKSENQNLKVRNKTLKDKVWELEKLIMDTSSSNTNLDLSSTSKRSKAGGKKMDLCLRRLDKLEELNYNLTELIMQVLTMTEYPDVEKIRLYSSRDLPSLTKQVLKHIKGFETRMKELKEENCQLDEECETYGNIIKNLKKETSAIKKANKEKTEALEAEIERLTKRESCLVEEKQDLLAKISKLESEAEKLKAPRNKEIPPTAVGNESKKINELKRTILLKEQKLLELQDLETQTRSYKTQVEYLKTALEREKKKAGDEKEKNQKLQNELNEVMKNPRTEHKNGDGNEMLDELRLRGSISGGVVQEFVEKEKTKKLAKDIAILKELCRARYAEIKRLEAVNAALRNNPTMNSNQMDSPIRSRVYNTRSKTLAKDTVWKSEVTGKENSPL